MDKNKVVLLGPMGVGKSTLGTAAARQLGWRYFDNDLDMVTMSGLSIEELSSLSVPELHALEAKFILEVIKADGPFITGAAASVIENPEIQKALADVQSIYLTIPLEEIYLRLSSGQVGRQAINDETDVVAERFARRDPLYRTYCRKILELSSDPDRDVTRLLELINS